MQVLMFIIIMLRDNVYNIDVHKTSKIINASTEIHLAPYAHQHQNSHFNTKFTK